jgi:hypothetical protein
LSVDAVQLRLMSVDPGVAERPVGALGGDVSPDELVVAEVVPE